jgi:hypothetical protein
MGFFLCMAVVWESAPISGSAGGGAVGRARWCVPLGVAVQLTGWQRVFGGPMVTGTGGDLRTQGEEVSCSVAPPCSSKGTKSATLLLFRRDGAQLTVGRAARVCAVQ